MATGLLPDLRTQLVMQPVQRAVIAPLPEIRPDRGPRGQIMRDAAPGTSGVQHIEQPVDDLPQIHRARATTQLRRGQKRFEDRPLGIGQI